MKKLIGLCSLMILSPHNLVGMGNGNSNTNKEYGVESSTNAPKQDYASLRQDMIHMEEYFIQNKNSQGIEKMLNYKIKILEYLPILEELKEYEKVKQCILELSNEYPSIDRIIENESKKATNIFDKQGLEEMRSKIKEKIKEEGIKVR